MIPTRSRSGTRAVRCPVRSIPPYLSFRSPRGDRRPAFPVLPALRRRPPVQTPPSRWRRLLPVLLPVVWGVVAVAWRIACPMAQGDGPAVRIVTTLVFFSVGTGLILGFQRALARQLRQVTEIAVAAQRVLLRPLPPRLEGLSLAAAQLSVAPGAAVGGDLYEAVATPYGVRLVIGDVRGHGLPALGAVAAVLGSFREAAHDEPELGGLLRRLERALGRHVGEARDAGAGSRSEEFVTVLLLEIRPDGEVLALNCGHPWPYRLGPGGAVPAGAGEPLPPLGVFPLPADPRPAHWAPLLPGETLFLHTDGAEDARDCAGRFFRLADLLAGLPAADGPGTPMAPAAVVRRVHAALLRHTGGRLTDDVALLVVRNDRPRVAAQPLEPGLRRAGSAPSSR
ncbi:serine/threonine-protein phosphatase [Streptomyces sp. LP05-1]|uniref:Serine/threonine-protein phosphatase n=1 Tax=Streptomyces pyxinae TaxID=2970734 RepID=A0ABT2CFI2_9ACTN|nr:PP2C family protein-serine/threonine phosphatase [Streptomyces sp. LP05-1]MCS0636174.1 serine/threonine-protein phosphatase [Streptomyces sp. LP05-1]